MLQKMPAVEKRKVIQDSKNVDALEGTIETDERYVEFVANLYAPQMKIVPQVNENSNEVAPIVLFLKELSLKPIGLSFLQLKIKIAIKRAWDAPRDYYVPVEKGLSRKAKKEAKAAEKKGLTQQKRAKTKSKARRKAMLAENAESVAMKGFLPPLADVASSSNAFPNEILPIFPHPTMDILPVTVMEADKTKDAIEQLVLPSVNSEVGKSTQPAQNVGSLQNQMPSQIRILQSNQNSQSSQILLSQNSHVVNLNASLPIKIMKRENNPAPKYPLTTEQVQNSGSSELK